MALLNKLSNCLTFSLALSNIAFASSAIETTDSTSTTSIETCNPLSATSSCNADTALATSISDNFKSSSNNYSPYRTPSEIFYGDDGLILTLSKQYDNPSLVSNFYIMFGKIEVLLKSANGTGIVSSFYLQSDDLDEIDMEWFGGDASQMQSNFFSKGDTSTYDRGEYHSMSDPRLNYHNYTIDWDEKSLNWYIDGELVRTLTNDSTQGYPQTPSRIFFGIWAGGDSSNAEGTIEWAGGETDYSDAPFSMYIKNLIVTDYSTGSEYKYTDTSGDWSSINAVNGEILGRKVIAEAEFASLVNGDSISNSNSTSSSKSEISSSTKSNITSSPSSSSSSSSSSSPSTTHKSITSTENSDSSSSLLDSETQANGKAKTASSNDSKISDEITSSKTVNLKSEYLSSSTTTLVTSTKKNHKSSSSDSSSPSIESQSNAANGQLSACSSIFTALVFIFSLL